MAPLPQQRIKRELVKDSNSDMDSNDQSNNNGVSDDEPRKKRLRPSTRQKQNRNQNKKRKISSGSSFDEESSGSEEEKFSRRRRVNPKRQAAKVCYRDDSDDSDLLEDKSDADEDELEPKKSGSVFSKSQKEFQIDKIIAQRRGKIGAVGPATTIYAIEENGDPNEDCDPNDLQSTEVQFLIKWKGSAYIHSTWESEKSLKETFKSDFHCTKKLRDFSNDEEEIAHLKKRATREDAEYFAYEHELQQSLVDSYYVVERIIAMSNDDDDQKSCLVKWQSLPYAEATWVDVALIERKWSDRIREYDEREKSDKFPSKTCSALNNRPKFKQLTSQPEYIAGGNPNANLRDYQLHGLNWLIYAWCSKNSVILADEMGLGKTIQIISFLHFLYHEHQVYGPFLVVVPLSTMTAWQREFELWAPGMNVVIYIGDKTSRKLIRDYEWCFANTHRPKFNVILTTYETVLCDKAILGSLHWAVLMVDEAHRLKNDESLLHKVLYEFHTYHRLLITGTPLQNDLKELWALLHFIMPSKFPSWEEFEEDHQDAVNQGFTTLHEQLEPFILRRVKKDVEKSLPAKVEQILRIEMTSAQKKFYRWILTKNFKALQKESKGSAKSFLNVIMQLRKCCNHSFLIEQPDSEESHEMSAEEKLKQLIRGSGKLLLLDKLLTRLRETGHRVLIFSQMVIMLDILAEYLEVRRFPFQRLDGGIRGDVRRLALDHFNAENSQDFCFLLSTRAGGLGINLATADTVIIFDSDYNPQNDLQAQARAHRIGQTKQVNIYRLVTANSVEEQIVERAKKKMILDHLIIQRMDTTGRTVLNDYKSVEKASISFNKDELSAILKFGAANLFKKDAMGDEEPVCDIDEILRRAEIREEEAPTTMGDELLSAFKMANFVATGEEDEPPRPNEQENDPNEDWDEIIPKNFRARLEEEERAKEMADSYLPPKRIRKTIHNNINDNDDDESDDDDRKEQLNVSKVSNYSEESNASSDDDESDDDDDDEEDIVGSQARVKTAAPNTNSKFPYEGFTITEIRNILASLKKFPAPMTRLTEVARAANVRYKTTIELKKLAAYVYDRCHELMRTYKNYVQTVMNSAKSAPDDAVPSVAPPMSFTIKNVTVNARQLLAAEEFLKPLNEVMPANVEERSSWTLKAKVKPGSYANVDWTIEDDSKLLRGIYQHGFGNWKAMKSDPSLGLEHKILRADDKELDSKGLKKRALYLLRILRNQISRNGAKKIVENGSGPEKKAGGSDAKHNSKEKMNRSGPERKTDDSDTEHNSEEEMNGSVPEGKTDDSDVECNSKVEKEMNGSGPEGKTDDSEESHSDNDSWKSRCSI